MDDNLRIWRSFQMGKLFDLIMLDTRNYDRSITSLGWNDKYIAKLTDDAGRSLMGSHQENWFYNQLSNSSGRGATWRIVGNQIIFSRINNTARSSNWLNSDQWDVSLVLSSVPSKELTSTRAIPPTEIAPYTTCIPIASRTRFSFPATHMQTGSPIWFGWIKCLTTSPQVLGP